MYGQHLKSNVKCAIVFLKDKVALWEDLSALKFEIPNLAWCFIGDFNAVRRSYERKGIRVCHSQKSEIIGFDSFIDRNLLVELHVMGKKYTWWMRERFHWESLQKVESLWLLSRAVLIKEMKDKQLWEGDKSGEFSVKSAYVVCGEWLKMIGAVLLCGGTSMA
ncbi:hypothetical protein VNO80_15785 [Phaseolus coccineus]|uniref:Endonuclease/exonuclease/phosphatase domain-containing protein n=1 Tax=Phaseolus coccineus TaxID=3886 RepID=A0AAN9MQW6_PHACN